MKGTNEINGQNLNRKPIGLVIAIIIVMSSFVNPLIYAQQNNTDTTFSLSPQEIVIVVDGVSVTTKKAATVLKALVEPYIPVNLIYVSSWTHLTLIIRHTSATQLVIYAFHGTKQGMEIRKRIVSWHTIMKLTTLSPSYQLFLSCYSASIGTHSSHILLTSTGPTDYVVSVLRAAFLIGRLCHRHQLLSSLTTKVSQSQYALLARLFFAYEPLWSNYTHYVLTKLAIDKVCNTIGWLNTILSQSNLFTTNLNTAVTAAYTNPDYEDYPNGDPLSFSNVTELMDTLLNHRTMLDRALRHVSFSATGSFYFQFPSWFYDPDLFAFLTSNYGEPELWSLVQNLDSLDGVQEGYIAYDTDIPGNALSRLFNCFDTAQSDYFSWTNYSWAQSLSRAAHYLQDQQMPYHTALVDELNQTVKHLDLIVSFSMKDTWLSIAKNHGLTESYARWFYDNKFEPLFRDYLAKNRTISWDLLKDFAWEAVGVLGFAYLLVCYLGPLIGLVVASALIYTTAQSTLDALYDFQATLDSYINDIKTMLEAIEDNNLRFKTQHDFVEQIVERYYIYLWYNDIESYVHNNLATAHQYAKQLIDSQQRTSLVEGWIDKSFRQTWILKEKVEPKSGNNQPQEVADTLKERLRQAALQSVALYEAFFIRLIYKYDSDADGMADFWEEKVFQTPVNSGKRAVTITQVLLKDSTRSSSKWEITLTIEETRPWKNIKVSMGYQLATTGEKVYIIQQSYTNTHTVNLGWGGITLTTGTFSKTIVETLSLDISALNIENIIVCVSFNEWKLGSVDDLTLQTPLSFTCQSTALFNSYTVEGISVPPSLPKW